MYQISYTSQVNKDIKRCIKRNYDFTKFKTVLKILENSGTLPPEYKPHKLSGNYAKHWECHIKPDWLLIWLPDEAEKEITLVRTGTHSDLF